MFNYFTSVKIIVALIKENARNNTREVVFVSFAQVNISKLPLPKAKSKNKDNAMWTITPTSVKYFIYYIPLLYP